MAKNVLPYKKVIKETLQKEKAVIKLFKDIGIESKLNGALDFSFCNEIISLLGIPAEKELSLYRTSLKNYDELINDYTAMIYGDKSIDETLTLWEKKLANLISEYDPKNNEKNLKRFFQQEQKLVKAIRKMGVSDNGPLANLICDWNLAVALLKKPEAELSQDLYDVLDNNGSIDALLKKHLP